MTSENTVAILGGKGMLGTDVASACRRQGFDVKVLDLPEFDITNERQVKNELGGIRTIVNCAAYTNVDGAESEAKLAYEVNAAAVGRLGAFVKETDGWLLHISTDFVFDGRLDRPYRETDKPNPINEYGKTKLAGEQLLSKSGCKHCILRVEWTYGSAGNNFVTKLIQRAKTNKNVRVVDDQIGSPTATTEVARVICEMLRRKPAGVFHFASAGYVSRYEMAKFVFDNLSMDVSVHACKSSDYTSAAARPLNSRFDCSKIQDILDEPIESWRGPLERFLRNL